MSVAKIESLLFRFGKFARIISLESAVIMRGLSKEAAARLALENIKGGRAIINASRSNAAVMPASES